MSRSGRLSVVEIATDARAGRRSAVEVAEAALERVRAYDDVQPQAWIYRVGRAEVVSDAQRVEQRLAAGDDLPLAGVPFAVKDNIDVAGLPTTAGCPAFTYIAADSAPVVARLQDAGAILIGKTNLDQFATGLVGTRSPYGACGAVHNREWISGGSSSGSAVAVAAGLVAFALGTDTAGSGRVPAALNHLVGLKPTKGRWSARGVVPACRTQDCVSVLSADVAGARAVDAVAARFDGVDPFSREPPSPRPAGPISRIGIPRPGQLDWRSDAQSPSLFEATKARLAQTGAQLVEVDIAFLLEAGRLLYDGPWVAERTAVAEALLRDQPSALDPVVRAILQGGVSISAVDGFRAEYRRRAHQRTASALWGEVEALLLPTTATTYRIREVTAEPFALNAALGHYTNFVNLLDMSAVAIPAGFRDNATAFGVSLIGPAWADLRLLDLAQRYEAIAPAFDVPPLDLAGATPKIALAVVGAHLAGMPLHWQLTSRGARLARRCRTAPVYRLYAMANTQPPKPALAHVGDSGGPIEVEVYELDVAAFGDFAAEVPPPLAIGTVTLEDGTDTKGFVAEPRALAGAEDITHLGGWRAYVARQSS